MKFSSATTKVFLLTALLAAPGIHQASAKTLRGQNKPQENNVDGETVDEKRGTSRELFFVNNDPLTLCKISRYWEGTARLYEDERIDVDLLYEVCDWYVGGTHACTGPKFAAQAAAVAKDVLYYDVLDDVDESAQTDLHAAKLEAANEGAKVAAAARCQGMTHYASMIAAKITAVGMFDGSRNALEAQAKYGTYAAAGLSAGWDYDNSIPFSMVTDVNSESVFLYGTNDGTVRHRDAAMGSKTQVEAIKDTAQFDWRLLETTCPEGGPSSTNVNPDSTLACYHIVNGIDLEGGLLYGDPADGSIETKTWQYARTYGYESGAIWQVYYHTNCQEDSRCYSEVTLVHYDTQKHLSTSGNPTVVPVLADKPAL